MNNVEFNLIDEPWIRVMDNECKMSEVSLKDVILNAHRYKSLSGELPTQDIALMRLILAVLHTVYSRVDENGDDALLDDEDEDEAIDRWKALWGKGRFSEKAISEYFDKWHERFWLFHTDRPFGQVAGLKIGTRNSAQKLNGEISQSLNSKRWFSLYSGIAKESLTYSQAARWLIYLNGYDDVALKPTKEGREKAAGKLPSAKRGWLGQLGLIYMVGDNLFETLMLNLVMVCNGVVQSNQKPLWETDYLSIKERQLIPTPDNLAELYTMQFRFILLERKEDRVIGYLNVAGFFFGEDVSFKEPMTIWKQKEEHSTEMIPKKHDPTKQMWREFSSIINAELPKASDSQKKVQKHNEKAEVLKWYVKHNVRNKKEIQVSVVSLVYDESKTTSLPVKNVFCDSLIMHSDLLTNLGADWRNTIEQEINRCSQLANAAAFLAQNLYVASGGSKSDKDKHYKKLPDIVKSQIYYRFDVPFRKWLRTIDPENYDEKQKYNKQREWQEMARKIAESYAYELVSETDDSAIVGHKVDNTIYSSSKAMIIFRGQLNKIYT